MYVRIFVQRLDGQYLPICFGVIPVAVAATVALSTHMERTRERVLNQ